MYDSITIIYVRHDNALDEKRLVNEMALPNKSYLLMFDDTSLLKTTADLIHEVVSTRTNIGPFEYENHATWGYLEISRNNSRISWICGNQVELTL